jgi:exonuclease SbcD
MRVLHTSDWHLGASLHGKRRYEEAGKFLGWLVDTIREEGIDLLIVSGDVFDSSAPGARAQEMYYQFLGTMAHSRCRSVVVVAGNHDSPSFIAAPRDVLRFLDIHVVGDASGPLRDLVIPVSGGDGDPGVIVCAVPFLREKDLLQKDPEQPAGSRSAILTQGIREYYDGVAAIAREGSGGDVPVIATGHLFAAGCETKVGDGVRECYIGDSVKVGTDVFSPVFSYVALGHLHVPQVVAGNRAVRYPGSPIPIGFSEIDQQKTVIIIDTGAPGGISVTERPVPRFQRFASLKGSRTEVERQVRELAREGVPVFAEVTVDSMEPPAALQNWLSGLVRGTGVECLKLTNVRVSDTSIIPGGDGVSLQDLTEKEVFRRRLDEENLPSGERDRLMEAFGEILVRYHQRDLQAGE